MTLAELYMLDVNSRPWNKSAPSTPGMSALKRAASQSAINFQRYDKSNAQAQRQLRPTANAISGFVQGNTDVVMTPLQAMMGDKAAQSDLMARIIPDPNRNYESMFVGKSATKANLSNLKKAEQMIAGLERGTPEFMAADRAAWKETGWTHAFPDGKPRFEIPDNGMKLQDFYQTTDLNGLDVLRQQGKLGSGVNTIPADSPMARALGKTEFPYSGVLEHPDLYNNYPDIKNIYAELNVSPQYANKEMGFFNPSGEGRIEMKSHGTDSGAVKSGLSHELQHAIQEREGFARGGSPSDPVPSFLREQMARETFAKLRPIHKAEGVPISETWQLSKDYSNSPDVQRLEIYKRLAGEAESRLTQRRMDYDAAKRRDVYPIDEFDVPVDRQIVRGLDEALLATSYK